MKSCVEKRRFYPIPISLPVTYPSALLQRTKATLLQCSKTTLLERTRSTLLEWSKSPLRSRHLPSRFRHSRLRCRSQAAKVFAAIFIFLLGGLSARPQVHVGDSLGHMLVQQSPIDPWHASDADSCFELISFPNDYNANPTKKYPVIFFFHGMGEAGPANGSQLSLQLENALPQLISQGYKPSAVGADGNTYKFIVVCPQATGGSITIQQFWYILPDILKKIRADTTRMYITGLSYGGYGTWTCLTDDAASPYQGFISHFAAILPQSQVALDQSINTGNATNYNRVAHVKDAATDSLPVLIVCGDMDDKWQYSVAYKDSINAHHPYVPAILIDRTGLGHVAAAWDSIYSPTFRPPDIGGKNGYEWLIQYTNKRGFKLGAAGSPPVVKVEGAQSITMPTSTITLSGSGTPSTGYTITSHVWTKSSGGAATITSSSSDTTTVTGLAQGAYTFVLTVTDNTGQTATSAVAVTVNAAASSPPVVKVESAQSITMPTSTVTLSGSGTPSAGHTITSHVWTKSSGGAATITSPSSDTTTVTGLAQGAYTFVLTVTDNTGETATSAVAITVNAAASSPPVVKVESAQSITMPTSTVTLSGSGTPSAGHTITSHVWTKSSGGAATITSPSSDTTTVTGLAQGAYTFVLTVTDNTGETATSSVAITVNAASSTSGSTPPVTAVPGKYSVANGEYANFILDNTTQTLYGVGNGAIGNGTNTGLDGLPIACQFPTANTKIKFVAAGLHGAACIDVSGNVYFTGPNEDGDMGNGTTTGSATSFVPITTDSAGNPFTNVTYLRLSSSIFTGGQGYGAIIYAIKSDGTLWVWGNTQGGYRGDGTYGRVNTKPVQITTFPAGTVITKVIVENVAIALDANGNVWTWAGNNTPALLGNSSQTNYETPQKITLPTKAIDIAGGGFFSYALLENHSLYGWGWYTGYMGVGCCSGSGVVGLNPPAIPMLLDSSLDLPSPISRLSTNGTSTYVILSDGTLWAWGGNECGQIGNGQEINWKIYTVNPAPYGGSTPSPYDWNQDASTAQLQQHKPIQIAPGISNFVDLSEGSASVFYKFAIDANGQLYSWGRNKNGVLANGVIEGDYISGGLGSLYPNSFDVPYITAINPFALTETIFSTSPLCISVPGANSCSVFPIPLNTPPVANAGSNQTVPGPTAVLDGSASKDNSAIVYYIWSQVSGPNQAIISIPSGEKANLLGLTKGVYVFKLKVIDNGWMSDSANVTITVLNTIATTQDAAILSDIPASSAMQDTTLSVKTGLGIYPNPVTDGFTLVIGNAFMGPVDVELIDATGAIRHEYSFDKELQTVQYNMSAGDLLRGIYFLRVRIGTWTGSLKVVKK